MSRPEKDMLRQMLFVEEVLPLVRVSRTTLFRMERERRFPASHMIRGRKVWFADELAAWQEGLPSGRPRSSHAKG